MPVLDANTVESGKGMRSETPKKSASELRGLRHLLNQVPQFQSEMAAVPIIIGHLVFSLIMVTIAHWKGAALN